MGVNAEIDGSRPSDCFQAGGWWASKSFGCLHRTKVFALQYWPRIAVGPQHFVCSCSSDQTRGLFCGSGKICQACGAPTNFIFCFRRETSRQIEKDFFIAGNMLRLLLLRVAALPNNEPELSGDGEIAQLLADWQPGTGAARIVPGKVKLFPVVVVHRVVVGIEQHAMIRVEIAGRTIAG